METQTNATSEQLRLSALDRVRIAVPAKAVAHRGRAGEFFDILPNNSDLTEEYLYSHQPVTRKTIPVYSPSIDPVGSLDDTPETRQLFSVLRGPVIIVARKGYAGRLTLVTARSLIVHEDAYAIRPKPEFVNEIELEWFAGHYSAEFQANRTALWGIGDFPREKFQNMTVIIPTSDFQNMIAPLYSRRRSLLERTRTLREDVEAKFSELLRAASGARAATA